MRRAVVLALVLAGCAPAAAPAPPAKVASPAGTAAPTPAPTAATSPPQTAATRPRAPWLGAYYVRTGPLPSGPPSAGDPSGLLLEQGGRRALAMASGGLPGTVVRPDLTWWGAGRRSGRPTGRACSSPTATSTSSSRPPEETPPRSSAQAR